MLRKPLNLPRGSEQDELEEQSFHIAAYHNDAVVGVGRLHIEADSSARIRYMAVHENYQKQGIGSTILGKLEKIARTSKPRICWLYARQRATGFYSRKGYVAKGTCNSELSELNLNHQKMEKLLPMRPNSLVPEWPEA